MQKKDPYAHQKEKKAQGRQKILSVIETKSPTFGEIENEVGLSRPVLTQHLRGLEKDRLITRQVNCRRIEYVLTDKGKSQERIRRETLAKSFDVIGKLAKDYSSAKSLFDLSELARSEPKFFDEFMQWMKDYTILVTSEDTIQWMKKHGDSGGKLLQAEIMKRLKPKLETKISESEDELKALILTYQNLLTALREIISERS